LSDSQPFAFKFTRSTFASIENAIADNRASVAKMNAGIDLLVRGCILIVKGGAQTRSAGPIAPRKRSVPALAFKIPVQRITGAYYAGWTQRRLGNGHWVVYNDTVEAYLIEYGIHQRVRRPILKLSVLGMYKFLQTTPTINRFMDWVIAPRRDSRGRFQSFQARMAGTTTISEGAGATISGLAGPQGNLP
jgi:hypothetical protein